MSAKIPPSPPEVDAKTAEAVDDRLVLRDESDALIDRLKRRVQHLQEQLDQQQAAPVTPPARGGRRLEGERGSALEQWQAGLAARLTSRLERPAEDLTRRLTRLMNVVRDPEIKQELEKCRQTASFIFQTFHEVNKHQLRLSDSLKESATRVHVETFAASLQAALPQVGTEEAASLFCSPHLPRWLNVRQQSLLSVMRTLGELARRVSDAPLKLQLERLDESTNERNAPQLGILLLSERPWPALAEREGVASIAFKEATRAETAVNVLYAEKIVALSGGELSFYRHKGQVHGLVLRLPLRLNTDEHTPAEQETSTRHADPTPTHDADLAGKAKP